jgi:GT2 family glycosyltransferase
MIAFGSCVGSEERFARYALPGIMRAVGPDAVVLTRREDDSIFPAYNSILEEAQGLADLEALVLLHEDTEIREREFEARLRRLFSDGSIGVAGAIGASNVTSLAWWEGERHGRVSWNGPGPEESVRTDDFGAETQDVDCVDGLLLVLSPWTVENVRFDDRTFAGFHGYDVDFCFSVRDAGKRVVASDLPLHHHDRSYMGFSDRVGFLRANIRWRAKWGFDSTLMVPARLGLLTLRSKAASARIRLSGND